MGPLTEPAQVTTKPDATPGQEHRIAGQGSAYFISFVANDNVKDTLGLLYVTQFQDYYMGTADPLHYGK